MKKNFGKLFIIFGVLICIFALVGCDLILGNNPDPEKNPVEEGSLEESFVPDEELIEALIDYRETFNKFTMYMSFAEVPFCSQIDDIKNGAQLLQAKFDPNNCYYVCAYYVPGHDCKSPECGCIYDYLWIGFKNEDDIKELYKGLEIIDSFQINKAKDCIGIITQGKEIPSIEHFRSYKTVFENGVNVAGREEYDEFFLYVNSSNDSKVYYCSDNLGEKERVIIPYVELDGEKYIALRTYFEMSEEISEIVIQSELGKYYDDLIDVMITDKYFTINPYGEKVYYGIFEINAFVDKVLK